MPESGRTVVRVGSYSARRADVARLLARHGTAALLPRNVPGTDGGEASDVEWALRQATLRALAVPPRLGARWTDIEIRRLLDGRRTLLLRGELARFAETVVRGDIQLTATADGDRVTAWAVLTRVRSPPFPATSRPPPHATCPSDVSDRPEESEVPE